MTTELNSKQIKFARIYSETNDALLAYKEAYAEKAEKTKWLRQNAYGKLENPKIKSLIEEIQQALRMQFVMLAPDALANIVELSNNAENERVKLEASKEILYGAGLKPPEQIEMKTIGIFGSSTVEDIRETIRKNLEDSVEAEVVENAT